MTMWRRLPIFALTFSVGGWAFQAVDPRQERERVLRSRVDIVRLDVSVLDRGRRPVRGLEVDDFQILEDGRAQSIQVFQAVDVPDVLNDGPVWARDVLSDVTSNEQPVARLLVLVIDDALIPQEPWIIRNTDLLLKKVIGKLGPHDLAAAVFTGDNRRAQDFTNDQARLREAVDRLSPGLARWDGTGGPDDQDLHWYLSSVSTLLSVVRTLSAAPQTRKAVIWVTPGIPLDLASVGPSQSARQRSGTSPLQQDVHLRVLELTREVFAVAALANIPIYPVDPCGLGGLAAYISRGREVQTERATFAEDYILSTASSTGGRAVVKTNDLLPSIDDIFEENSSYYLLGFAAATPNDGKQHRIEVRVKRDGVTVRMRKGYYGSLPGPERSISTQTKLMNAIAAPVAAADLPMRATVAPFAMASQGNKGAVVIVVGVRQPVPEAAASGRTTVTTRIRTSAFTPEGEPRGSQEHTAKVVVRSGATGQAEYEVLSRIELAPGRYRLRVAAHDESAAKTGSVMVDVVVPDFWRDTPSMSGVVLAVTPARPSAPRDLFRDILSIVPTTQRTFATGDRAVALFQLYQRAGQPMAPATVHARIAEGTGTVVATESWTLPIERFISQQGSAGTIEIPQMGGRKGVGAPPPPVSPTTAELSHRPAEIQYPLPLGRLRPGAYLLTFEVLIGRARFRRDAQFIVR